MKTKIFLLTFGLVLCISHHTLAAEFMVVTTADGIDFNPGDGKCESVLTNKPCTLRAAIMENNALPTKNTIIFAPTDNAQTYELTAGTPLEISHPVNIIGLGADKTIIDGLSKTRILQINLITPSDPLNPGNNMVYLQGVTLTKGKTNDQGGAIQNLNADILVILDSTIGPNNVADKDFAVGGAIYHHHGLLHIDNSVLTNNSAGVSQTKAGYGGAIYLRDGSLQINNTQFQDNKAYKYGGGGALFVEGGTFHISGNSQFVNNQAGYGGAIYNKSLSIDTDNNPNNELVAVTFSNNMANNGDGGAINNEGVVQIIQSTFNDNKATKTGNAGIGRGGAIFQDTAAVLKFYKLNTIIEKSTFSKNEANNVGGAIYQRPGYIDITQTTFSENSATNNGGAIWLGDGAYTSGTLTISESLFELNSATNGKGGAIYTKNSTNANKLATPIVKIYNSTISGNSAQNAGGIYAADKSDFELYHVTVALNTCTGSYGCGIIHEHLGEFDLNHANFVFNQSLITGNHNPDSPVAGDDCFGFFTSDGGNLIGERDETGYKTGKYHCEISDFDKKQSAGDVDLKEKFAGKNIPVIDPLAQNGGPTKTHALSLGSPAINQGLPSANNQCLKADLPFAEAQKVDAAKYTKDQTTINVRNFGERCDAGAFENQCGNGVKDAGEECDNGPQNSSNPNSCRTTCTNPACGDGIVDSGEECDDGNDLSIDGCSAFCKLQPDNDGDGFYDTFLKGSKFNDCDDTRADINPKADEICGDEVDQNCDKVDLSCDYVDNDNDGQAEVDGDCDDTDPDVKKSKDSDVCDGKDNNCDGIIDGNTDGVAAADAKTFYMDADGDGHGGEDKTVKACSMPEGSFASPTDCDDTRADINPDIKEICDDEVDQDCNGADLDCKDFDADGDGVTPNNGDCDDANALVHPGEPEHCDKIDNTCNGEVDEGCESIVPKDGEDAPPFIPVGPIVDDLGGGDSGVDDTGDVDDPTGEDDDLGPTDAGDGDNADDNDTDADADASEDENDGDGGNSNDDDAVDPNAVQEAQKGSGAPACSLNPGSVDISLTLLLLVSFVMMIARKRRQQHNHSLGGPDNP